MSFIYHMVPKNMEGAELIPLQELELVLLERYLAEIKKYDDHPKRKLLPKRIIKKINCFQEEVLHFTPIHPNKMFQGLKSVFPEWNYSQSFYEIPIEHTRGLPTVFFDMNRTGQYVFGEDEPEELFEIVTPETYKIMTELPIEAIEFYNMWKSRGERGAPAMGRIPHIMVKGRVSVKNCKVIDWKDA